MINRILASFALILAVLASAPAEARFYSTDPVGYEDQLNLYAYVHNDPVNATDPTGMDTVRNDTDETLIVRGNPPKEGDASGGGKQMYGAVPNDGEVYGGEDNPIPAYDSKEGAEAYAESPYVARPPDGEVQDVDGYIDPATGEDVQIRGDSKGPETTVGQDENGNTTQERKGVPAAYGREAARRMGLERQPTQEPKDNK